MNDSCRSRRRVAVIVRQVDKEQVLSQSEQYFCCSAKVPICSRGFSSRLISLFLHHFISPPTLNCWQ